MYINWTKECIQKQKRTFSDYPKVNTIFPLSNIGMEVNGYLAEVCLHKGLGEAHQESPI